MEFSAEQKRIIEHVSAVGGSACVDAVAGSGKTTTVIGIAQAMSPRCRILLVTYNSMLKKDVRLKMASLGLGRQVTVHNYHSLAVRAYDSEAHTDERIERIIREDLPVRAEEPAATDEVASGQCYKVVVVDEVQDMTPLYYRLLRKYMRDARLAGRAQMVLLGDVHQSIYDFKGADARFLRLAARCFEPLLTTTQGPPRPSGAGLACMTLRSTYRCPESVARFVNRVMLRRDRMVAVRPSSCPVDYVRYNSCIPAGGEGTARVVRAIVQMIRDDGAPPHDVFVLAPSLRNNEAATQLENELSAALRAPIYVSCDEGLVDEQCMRHKLIMTTYHRSKGLEKPLVVMLGFDMSYFLAFARGSPSDACPSTLYVAATRASRRLIVVEDMAYGPLPFLAVDELDMSYTERSPAPPARRPHWKTTCVCANDRPVRLNRWKHGQALDEGARLRRYFCTPSQTVRYLQDRVYAHAELVLEGVNTHSRVGGGVDVPLQHRAESTVCGSSEDVSALNGVAIPFMYEACRCAPGAAPRLMQVALEKVGKMRPGKTREELALQLAQLGRLQAGLCAADLAAEPDLIAAFLKLANITRAIDSRFLSQLRQVKAYTWLAKEQVLQCHAHMSALLPADPALVSWEYHLKGSVYGAAAGADQGGKRTGEGRDTCAQQYNVEGYVDAVCTQHIYEFKCVQHLTVEHVLQLSFYMWMWDHMPQGRLLHGPRTGKLVNVRDGHVITLCDAPSEAHSDVPKLWRDANAQQPLRRTVITHAVEYILHHKFGPAASICDDEFVCHLHEP